MGYSTRNLIFLAFGALIMFGVVAVILLRVMPGPHKETDYLVIGAVATLISLLGVFVVLINTSIRTSDLFYVKKSKSPDSPE